MGQYYKPINLDSNESLYSFDFDNGAKLMEHSYIGNKFVGAVENLLMPNHKWHMKPIVWAGDYADPELDKQGIPLMDDEDYELNLYRLASDENILKPPATNVPKEFKYIVNHTKKQYVNKDGVPKDSYGWKIHPLPLLTCEGNGNGGGDFRGESNLVGSWARDVISIERECPRKYKKLNFYLVEN